MMKSVEILKLRYLQALEDLINPAGVTKRWIPCVMIGDGEGNVLEAAFYAAKGSGRSMIVLHLTVDEKRAVQHHINVAMMTGKKQQIIRDCVLWAADAKSRLLIVPRSGAQHFRVCVDRTGGVERRAGFPARDTTFGIALAAKRLRDYASTAVPDLDMVTLSHTSPQTVG